jgi:hypothetical protein
MKTIGNHLAAERSDLTGWLTMQSDANPSPNQIPCEQGILQGILRKTGSRRARERK